MQQTAELPRERAEDDGDAGAGGGACERAKREGAREERGESEADGKKRAGQGREGEASAEDPCEVTPVFA